tara:strand:+ start:98 stop:1336 length:1239 start_codon:yes stop_codon:yes gene_type:complete
MKKTIFLILMVFCLYGQKVFVACEGNFYQANGSLWTIDGGTAYEFENNPIGETVQSLYVYSDQLFVIVNGSHNIQVFDIVENGLILQQVINTNNSSPREMFIYNNYLYFSNWYSSDIKKLDLNTWQIINEIPMPGLPEDIVLLNGLLYISITMNLDWTDGDKVVTIDPEIDEIVEVFHVGNGPGDLLVYENDIYISRTYYDEDWNAFYGTSKISQDGNVVLVNYGGGAACGGSILSYQDLIYRVYDGGIAQIDENLLIMPDTRIGNFNSDNIYSVSANEDNIYFGITDFQAPDNIFILNSNGEIIEEHSVGIAPGDFAFWHPCISDGDVNEDSILNIADIVFTVSLIIQGTPYNCTVDMNNDGEINVVDIILMVQEALNISSFRGAANWLDKYFPEFKVKDRMKSIYSTQKQ